MAHTAPAACAIKRLELNKRGDPCPKCSAHAPSEHRIAFANADLWVCDACYGGGEGMCCIVNQCAAYDNFNGRTFDFKDDLSGATHCEGWLDDGESIRCDRIRCDRIRCDRIQCDDHCDGEFEEIEDGRHLCRYCERTWLKATLALTRTKLAKIEADVYDTYDVAMNCIAGK